MNRAARILVCDDEMLIRMWLAEHLEEAGYEVESFENGSTLLDAAVARPPDLVLLDLRLPDGSGLEFLKRLKERDGYVPVIMITAFGEVETAVEAVRSGAHHFMEKPVDLPELLLLVEQALQTQIIRTRLDRYEDGYRWQFSGVTLVGKSNQMPKVADLINRLGEKGTPSTVLIRGETGTGKGVVARAIHAQGPRREKPFISVNCTVLPENLVESELFGHEAGAFTDAKKLKRGLFELADGGTIFLDEIGDMPKSAQVKLLDFLETHEFRRVGGVRDISVNVHVIAATNRDLEQAVENQEFRQDLFYRLNVVPMEIPPLRERIEDIPLLASHFLNELCDDMSVGRRVLSPDAARVLCRHAWPGNARELRNAIERTLLLHEGTEIRAADLPPDLPTTRTRTSGNFDLPADGLNIEKIEIDLINQALARSGGNKTQAAKLLGLSRDTLRYRLEKHGLDGGKDPV